jgi:hypothetical protein
VVDNDEGGFGPSSSHLPPQYKDIPAVEQRKWIDGGDGRGDNRGGRASSDERRGRDEYLATMSSLRSLIASVVDNDEGGFGPSSSHLPPQYKAGNARGGRAAQVD